MCCWIKCNKCGHKCETSKQYDEERKKGLWHISPTSDGWTWEEEHDCEKAKKSA